MFFQILNSLFHSSGINLRLAVAQSRLAESYLSANLPMCGTVYHFAMRAKLTIIPALKTALKILGHSDNIKKTSLILADMKRIRILAEERIITNSYSSLLRSKTYVNRLKSVLQSHNDLLFIYEKCYKPDHLVIATSLEDKARVYTHLIQHNKINKNFVEMKMHYDLIDKLCLRSIGIKDEIIKKGGSIGANDFCYRLRGEYHLHRFQDLGDECEFEIAESLFKKSIQISLKWLGEYDYRLGVAYSSLANIYARCGMQEEVQDMEAKWLNWNVLQFEIGQSEHEQNHRKCLQCPNFTCIECFSCICQTKLIVKKIAESACADCFRCKKIGCIECYTCLCQSKFTVKRLDVFEDFFEVMKHVFMNWKKSEKS